MGRQSPLQDVANELPRVPGVSQTEHIDSFDPAGLGKLLSCGTSRRAFVCTAVKATMNQRASSQTGNTFAILKNVVGAKQNYLLIDSHPQLGGFAGSLIARASSSTAMVAFMYDDCGALASSGCLHSHLHVIVLDVDTPGAAAPQEDCCAKVLGFGRRRHMLAIEDAPRILSYNKLQIVQYLQIIRQIPPQLREMPRASRQPMLAIKNVPHNTDGGQTIWAPTVAPGEAGFNRSFLEEFNAARVPDCDSHAHPLLFHQRFASFALREGSRIQRLLVHRLPGMGKTRIMIAVLHSHYCSVRPKLALFPRRTLCANFYEELLIWPNAYRSFWCQLNSVEASIVCGHNEWQSVADAKWDLGHLPSAKREATLKSIAGALEMRRAFLNGTARHTWASAPGAPLLALTYERGGGSCSTLDGDCPRSAIMKIGYLEGSTNVYDNKIVLIDEAHNLVAPGSAARLQRLASLIQESRGSVIAGFTGTPIRDHVSDGDRLLQIISGSSDACKEGFLTSFVKHIPGLMPSVFPPDVADGILSNQFLQKETMSS